MIWPASLRLEEDEVQREPFDEAVSHLHRYVAEGKGRTLEEGKKVL